MRIASSRNVASYNENLQGTGLMADPCNRIRAVGQCGLNSANFIVTRSDFFTQILKRSKTIEKAQLEFATMLRIILRRRK